MNLSLQNDAEDDDSNGYSLNTDVLCVKARRYDQGVSHNPIACFGLV
jgi:hypothetical protein